MGLVWICAQRKFLSFKVLLRIEPNSWPEPTGWPAARLRKWPEIWAVAHRPIFAG